MEKFELTILGCGSAKPTTRHYPSCQAIQLRGRLYLIDCGEGAQQQLCRYHLPLLRLTAVFLSHLHGDHCFGLPGLLCTLSLHGRTKPLDVYGPAGLEAWMRPFLNFYAGGISFEVRLHELSGREPSPFYEDSGLSVRALPLDHRVDCVGFLLREQPHLPHIRRDMIDWLGIPFYAINDIKAGAGWETADGSFIPHERLVTPADPPRSYAYLSDTRPVPALASSLGAPTLLYHEATYTEANLTKAAERYHSTARQAAEMARAANARALLIGHYSSSLGPDGELTLLTEARSLFPRTRLTNEGMHLEIGTE